jgi:hypothetical protein
VAIIIHILTGQISPQKESESDIEYITNNIFYSLVKPSSALVMGFIFSFFVK